MGHLPLDGPRIHDDFEGLVLATMPRLIRMGYEPMNVAHLMEQRIAVRSEGTPQKQHDAWWDHNFDTADLWLQHADKGGKIIPYNAQVLQVLQQQRIVTNLVGWSLQLEDGLYEAMEGLNLTVADIKKVNEINYTPSQIKKSEIWKMLAGNSQERLDRYVESLIAETGPEQELMKLYLTNSTYAPTLQLWDVGNRQNGSYTSAKSFCRIGYAGQDHIVGVAPQAHVSSVIQKI